jgi:hypothetical protein
VAQLEGALAERIALVDAVNGLLDNGAVLAGQAVVSLGGVDLVYLGLNLVVSSVETMRRAMEEDGGSRDAMTPRSPVRPRHGDMLAAHLARPGARPSARVKPGEILGAPSTVGDPASGRPARRVAPVVIPEGERPESSLARLVLTLVELLRQVLEHQALRRMEGTGLSDAQIEQMGLALMQLEEKLAEIRDQFGLTDADLNVDLGPLGQLL